MNTSDGIWESTLVELNIVEMYLAFSVVAESTEDFDREFTAELKK